MVLFFENYLKFSWLALVLIEEMYFQVSSLCLKMHSVMGGVRGE